MKKLLADWFSQKNVDVMFIFYTIFITVPFQVRSFTRKNNLEVYVTEGRLRRRGSYIAIFTTTLIRTLYA